MIPFSSMQLCPGTATLLSAAMCSLNPCEPMLTEPTFWYWLSQAACGEPGLGTDLAEQNMGKGTQRDRLPTRGKLFNGAQSPLTHGHLCHLCDQRIPITWDAITAANVVVMIKPTKNTAFGHLCTPTYQTSRSNILFSKQAELSLWIK